MQTMYPGMVNSPVTELAAAITAAQTSITVLNGAALPAAPNLAVIGQGELAETILYTAKSGNALSGITRGLQGTARAWGANTPIARNFTEADYATMITNISDHDGQLTASTAAATANTIVKRDANGCFKAAAPSASTDVARKAETDALASQLTETTQQINDIKQILIASWHGVSSAIGSADATTALNSLFTLAKSQGKRYVYFDDPHTYNVSGDLTGARDLILIGDGAKIKSSNLKNYFIQIANSGPFGDNPAQQSKINSYADTNTLFATVAAAISVGTVNVTIWGDSISDGGSDVIGIRYGQNSTGVTQSSPQGATAGDSYYQRLIDMLTVKFPNVTFNFYNRAIGGALIQNSEDNKTFGGVSKPWPEHIRDTNPDLLIIAFGMNTSMEYAKTYQYCMERIVNYINTNYTKKPSISWITPPRPTMALENQWGSINSQISRHVVAYCTRKVGRVLGGYIIDAGRASDYKRTGIDYTSPIMRMVNISEVTVGNFSESGGVYSFPTGGNLGFNVQASDFVLEFDLRVTGTASGDSNHIWLGYNIYSENDQTVAIIAPNLDGLNHVVWNFSRYFEGVGVPSMFSQGNPLWNDGVWRTFRIEKRSEVLNIFVNGSRIIRDLNALNNTPGMINFIVNGTLVYQLRNLKLHVGEYKQFVPTMTEQDMWGIHVDGDYSIKPEIGGNGVNHPTTIGLEEVYCNVLREFVDDLAIISKKSMAELGLIPVPVIISSWDTAAATPTTTSGANLRYKNVPITHYPGVTTLMTPTGSRLTLRKDIKQHSDVVKLLAGQFAAYETAGVTQIFIAYTGSLEASYTFTAYYPAENV